MQRDRLKKVETVGLGIMERRGLVSKNNRLSLQTQCDLPKISKSGLYYFQKVKVMRILRWTGLHVFNGNHDAYSRFIVGWGLHSLHGENVIEVHLSHPYKSTVCLRSSTQIRGSSLPVRYGLTSLTNLESASAWMAVAEQQTTSISNGFGEH